jgi:Histidine kinase-like ATPase domain
VEPASVTFPGLPAIVPAARRYVRGVLEGTPRGDDVELIASEFIANAIRHTPSGDKGGTFTVRISGGNGWTRIEVSDAGTGQWHPTDALQYRVLPLGWAIWMTAPFYEAAADAGIWPDDAPIPAEVTGQPRRGERVR